MSMGVGEYQATCGAAAENNFRTDFREGLRRTPKLLPPKYFYNAIGSELFEQICELEEYFPTRVEKALLRKHGSAIARLTGPQCRVVEFGSGNSEKIRLLFEHLDAPVDYVPIDISTEHLRHSAEKLARAHPEVEVLPVAADYTADYDLPLSAHRHRRTLFFFPGSTIGNFLRSEAQDFLRHVARMALPEDGFLVGIALQATREVLERAYNDSAGLTAAFNLNILRRAQTELGAQLDLQGFRHEAVYDAGQARIEMRLVSKRPQVIELDDERFEFDQDEVLITEYSHKFMDEGFIELATEAGFRSVDFWTDPGQRFSIHYLART